MVLQYRWNGHADLRAGFTVTKKQGKAVARNRIRRRLREALRLSYDARPVSGWDIVVIGRRSAMELPFDTLLEDVRYALGKLAKMPREGGSNDA